MASPQECRTGRSQPPDAFILNLADETLLYILEGLQFIHPQDNRPSHHTNIGAVYQKNVLLAPTALICKRITPIANALLYRRLIISNGHICEAMRQLCMDAGDGCFCYKVLISSLLLHRTFSDSAALRSLCANLVVIDVYAPDDLDNFETHTEYQCLIELAHSSSGAAMLARAAWTGPEHWCETRQRNEVKAAFDTILEDLAVWLTCTRHLWLLVTGVHSSRSEDSTRPFLKTLLHSMPKTNELFIMGYRARNQHPPMLEPILRTLSGIKSSQLQLENLEIGGFLAPFEDLGEFDMRRALQQISQKTNLKKMYLGVQCKRHTLLLDDLILNWPAPITDMTFDRHTILENTKYPPWSMRIVTESDSSEFRYGLIRKQKERPLLLNDKLFTNVRRVVYLATHEQNFSMNPTGQDQIWNEMEFDPSASILTLKISLEDLFQGFLGFANWLQEQFVRPHGDPSHVEEVSVVACTSLIQDVSPFFSPSMIFAKAMEILASNCLDVDIKLHWDGLRDWIEKVPRNAATEGWARRPQKSEIEQRIEEIGVEMMPIQH